MIIVRKSADRGHFDHGWLDTFHSFSFGGYHDPAHMGFRSLRVINEDVVAPSAGFGMHPHRDMEIITYVLDGALEHRDSMGNHGVIRPGDIQYMSAGRGILHSEYNPTKDAPCRLMQIWIEPNERGAAPRYEQRRFPAVGESGRITLLASGDGRDGSMHIRQNADVYAAVLAPGNPIAHTLNTGRSAWVQVLRGAVTLGGQMLQTGDGAAVQDERILTMQSVDGAELLLFDLA